MQTRVVVVLSLCLLSCADDEFRLDEIDPMIDDLETNTLQFTSGNFVQCSRVEDVARCQCSVAGTQETLEIAVAFRHVEKLSKSVAAFFSLPMQAAAGIQAYVERILRWPKVVIHNPSQAVYTPADSIPVHVDVQYIEEFDVSVTINGKPLPGPAVVLGGLDPGNYHFVVAVTSKGDPEAVWTRKELTFKVVSEVTAS